MNKEPKCSIQTGGGDYAGRDMTKNIFNKTQPSVEQLRKFFHDFSIECKNGIVKNNELPCKLEHLMTQKKGETIVGLEEKLHAANKTDEEIEYAMELKEDYAKKLTKYQFYLSSQKINLFLLTTARSQFQCHVYPLIQMKKSDEEIKYALEEHVINYLKNMLQVDLEMVFDPEDVWGILYYLTGNCYIKWV